ncbi:MAG TPA: hypothetical protein VLZ89_11370 [Anaerolineales bacterium]|nr:hypothetical protein [Anaerolineales bacterium]
MKNTWIALVVVALAAFVLELPGWWWAMPIAGLIGGWIRHDGRGGFVLGGLGTTLAWLVFLIFFAVTSPIGKLLVVVSGVLGLDASLAFVPALLALIAAFLLGGLGGLTGGLFSQRA